MKKHILTLASACMIFFCGCQENEIETLQQGKLAVAFTRSVSPQENGNDPIVLNDVNGFRFEEGILKEIFPAIQPDQEGNCQLAPSQMRGTIYFLTNANAIIENIELQPEVTTETAFLQMKATADAMTANGFTMTGQTVLSTDNHSVTIPLKRSVARIDIDSPYKEVKVNRVTIHNICTEGYVNEYSPTDNGPGTESNLLEKDFGSSPFVNGKATLFYVPEQNGTGHEVELAITIKGAWHKLKTVLPSLQRNKVYTLSVYSNGPEVKLSVKTDDWEIGESSNSSPALLGIVDTEHTIFPDGVTVNSHRDSVFVPSWETQFDLGLMAESGATVSINGKVEGVEVTHVPSRNLSPIASVNINSRHKMPGTVHEYIYLDVHKENVHQGRVVVVFRPNPIHLEGAIKFDQNGTCDFNRYIDGVLGTIKLPEGKLISVDFGSEPSQWMKLTEEGDNTYRILGGWKPNDPLADGRQQTAQLIVTDTDGAHKEVFTIRRQNWGLPVVNINGVWWCKYNLRGNVKQFTDQILINDDPAKGITVGQYMRNCSDDEFLSLLGGQYQAGNPDALPMVHNGQNFYYEGYSTNTKDFGTLPATEMAPDGYQIPDYDNYRFFAWGNNCNLGYHDPGVFNNGLGQRLNFSVVERNATFNGHEYGPVTFYDFELNGDRLVLCGTGHQWNETEIASMSILFATSGRANYSWMIEGYAQSTQRGNWIKYAANNAQKTRAIRCIKTPVEYIYQ